jgi:hypothetical protein
LIDIIPEKAFPYSSIQIQRTIRIKLFRMNNIKFRAFLYKRWFNSCVCMWYCCCYFRTTYKHYLREMSRESLLLIYILTLIKVFYAQEIMMSTMSVKTFLTVLPNTDLTYSHQILSTKLRNFNHWTYRYIYFSVMGSFSFKRITILNQHFQFFKSGLFWFFCTVHESNL